ncbi:hypothetical protein OIU84_021322 [Salix udensis]|uniref:Uncharacterized protein n=1 Tax=Salix udensis TaxID=889485 RepID=A0AAD6KUE0_9ROSI|nr:hypothetical protein OIU84_021322 [Salix udensis]
MTFRSYSDDNDSSNNLGWRWCLWSEKSMEVMVDDSAGASKESAEGSRLRFGFSSEIMLSSQVDRSEGL